MLKARLIKHICQRWIAPALGPKLIGSWGRGAKHLVAQYIQEKELFLRCGQVSLFRDNYRLYSCIDSFLWLLMAAKEMEKQTLRWETKIHVPCVKS